MKIIGIVTNGRIEVLNMTMALFGFQMHLLWIRILKNPVVFLLVIGERRLQLRIRIPHDYLMLRILPLLLGLMWPILLISLRHFSIVSRYTPAGHGTAYVSSTALMDLRPVASSSLGSYFPSR